jgi:hypothetical protein
MASSVLGIDDEADPDVELEAVASVPIRVGAILLFFFSPPSSFSLSLWSRLIPLTELVVLRGVCGGVVMGIPVMKLIFPAAMLGIDPPTSVGLLIIVPAGWANDDWVATEDVEFDLVGEEGRMLELAATGAGGGEGATDKLEDVRWWCPPAGNGDGGAIDVGVAIGVFWEEEWAVLVIIGCLAVGVSPAYIWPSSPCANVNVEQNPSDDVMSKVCPSFDLWRVSSYLW